MIKIASAIRTGKGIVIRFSLTGLFMLSFFQQAFSSEYSDCGCDDKKPHIGLSGPLPVIDNGRFLKSFNLGLDINFNRDDILPGIMTGLQTNKLNMSFIVGYTTRIKAKKVLSKDCLSWYTCEYKEGRSFLYLEVHKRFGINIKMTQTGILIGGKGAYSFGKYRNTKQPYEGKLFATPVAGLYWMNNDAMVRLSYEYINLTIDDSLRYESLWWPDAFKHRLTFSFIWSFNFAPTVDF